jgi:hypothetical protein
MIPVLISFVFVALCYAAVLKMMLPLLQTNRWWVFLLYGGLIAFAQFGTTWLSNRIDQVIK